MSRATPQRYVLPKNLRDAVKYLSDGELDLMHDKETKRKALENSVILELDEDSVAPYQNGEIERRGSLTDPWSDECGAVSIQSRHNAIANCPGVRYSSIGCAAGFGA